MDIINEQNKKEKTKKWKKQKFKDETVDKFPTILRGEYKYIQKKMNI